MAGCKRILGVLLAAALLLIGMPAKQAKAYTTTFGVVYQNDTVNLRQQATQYSTKLGTYTRGTWVTITGESGNWYFVTGPDGKTGYMSKNYVEVITPSKGAVAKVTNPKSDAFLNLRSAPSYSATVLGIYYNTTPVVLLNLSDGWYCVQVDGKVGYLREEYVTVVGATVAYSQTYATIITPNNSGLNLRTGPSMNYASAGMHYGGEYVMVLQQGTGWAMVSVDGQVGYMNTTYLKSGLLSPSEVKKASKNSGSSNASTASGYALVTNPRSTQLLNLRESPAKTARVVGQFCNGTKVNVLHQGTEWCKVQVVKTGAVGYMMTSYLTLFNLPATPVKTVNHPQKTYVNLRSLPSQTTGSVLTRIPHGATVTVLIPGDSWVKVRYNGYEGYAMAIFLK